ncbi:hypothetical protein LY76DRAFT_518470 [Colletotrichum caudatum]|nr:hypothetical protein LY76DRAFT_518470 [Colletotrichum caudatum]
MPPKKNSTDAPGHNCNNSEVGLMLAILRQIDRPTIDMDALAETVGAATANAARTRVSAAASKHGWFINSAAAAAGNASSPVTPRGKKAAGSGAQKKKAPADHSEGEELQTPSKKKRVTAKAKSVVKAEPAEGSTTHEQNDAFKETKGEDET